MPLQDISFTDLIASSIHDMKNSVNVQVNALEKMALQSRAQGDQSGFDELVLVINQAHRMNANLIQLLTLYKLGKSIYPIDIDERSVADVISETLLQMRTVFEFKGIALDVQCAPDCYGYFDRDLVTGVLLNALNNACNYTQDKIRVTAQFENGFLALRVEDNGQGYPSHLLLAEGVAAAKGVNFLSGSTGLGFYFSSLVAQLHQNNGKQGELIIENGGAYGGGCFVLKLP
jgi:signal transduction histidine kinase